MDFTFTPEQDEAAELAAKILGDRATNERMKAVEADGSRFDRDLWAELGSAGLLGPRAAGGVRRRRARAVELCRVLVEVGRTVAPVPLAAHGPAARLLAEHGSDAQKQQWLPGAATGANVLTAAVAEERAFAPERPTTQAAADGDGYRLTGSKAIVPAGPYADVFLVPAETPDGVGVFLVEPGDAGRDRDRADVLRPRRRRPGRPRRRRASAPTGWSGRPTARWTARLRHLLLLAGSAEQLGICEGALR